MKKRILAAAGAALLALTGAPAAHAADLTDTGHKPGNLGYGVDLPADTTYDTAEGTRETHPCAGRKLLYQSHNDALYGTRINGADLAVMAVDGQHVVPMDTVCFRLAPDAKSDGTEASRMVITDELSFLGNPGDIVWIAPQAVNFLESWRPLWSGLGAFDPAHEAEGAVPTNFKDNVIHFDMVDYQGPGDMQIFFHHNFRGPQRYFDSSDPGLHSFSYRVGGHGHFNWTFTEPGIYSVQWQLRAELDDGTTEKSAPVTQYWLVGDDPTVGLKQGTTTNLNPITDPLEPAAADTPAEAPVETPAEPPAGTPAETPDETPVKEPVVTPRGGSCALATRPSTFIGAGHLDLALVEEDGEFGARLNDDSDPNAPVWRDSGSFLLEVGDTALTEIPDTMRGTFLGEFPRLWVLPQAQDQELPWPGFSTTHVNRDAVEPGADITLSMEDVEGPGDLVIWHELISGPAKRFDSRDASAAMTYGTGAHDHLAFGFSEPGLYAATFVYTGMKADGTPFREKIRSSFAVGNDAINEARAHRDSGYAEIDLDDCAPQTAPGATPRPAPGGNSGSIPEALADGFRSIEDALTKLVKDITPGTAEDKKPAPAPAAQQKPGGKPGAAANTTSTPAPRAAQAPAGQPAPVKTPAPGKPAPAPAAKPAAKPAPAPAPAAKPAAKPAPAAAPAAPADAEPVDDEPVAAEEEAPLGTGSGIVSSIDGDDPDLQAYDAASQGVTAGGFWAGLAFGIGAMALIAGCVLFAAAWRVFKKIRSHSSE